MKLGNFQWNKHSWGALLAFMAVIAVSLACGPSIQFGQQQQPGGGPAVQVSAPPQGPTGQPIKQPLPTFTLSPNQASVPNTGGQTAPGVGPQTLVKLHDQVNPGVVSIYVVINQNGQQGEAAGSGFILDDSGHIITNNHVVEGANNNQVTVVFYNGIQAYGQVAGTDVDSDLAVVQVQQMPDGAHPLPLADSDKVNVGEWVVAIGNPFGLGGSMTVGIVSATGRTLLSQSTPFSIPEAIQTDAAINPGNSGGPLIDLNGNVVGVNSQIATGGQTNANAGVGFAIPINIVRRVAPVLIQHGQYSWPWLGIQGGSVTLALQQQQNLPTQQGAYIATVEPGGPADKAGLQPGDVVVQANGQTINNFDDLLVQTAFSKPGDQMKLTVLRNGQQRQITVTLEPRPSNFNNLNTTP
jgi:2-alkenal reductase